jgi:prepilin-type processing-associated H-X9-DG protein
MYSHESEGEVYPPLHVEITHPDLVNPDHPNPSKWNSFLYSFTPRVEAIFPEYFNDYKVSICPSDSTNRLTERNDLRCVTFDNSWDEGRVDPEHPDGCADEIGDSYVYFAWVFDKVGIADPHVTTPPVAMAELWRSIGQDIDFSAEAVYRGDTEWYPLQLTGTLTAAQERAWPLMDDAFGDAEDGHKRFLDVWDDDQTVTGDPMVDLGNGHSSTVYRLREGIERFYITDINSVAVPAGNIEATIPTALDMPSTMPHKFNHIPGGSNVLYMDGHVEFIKFNDRAPVNSGVARVVEAIQYHDFRKGR